VFLSFLLRHAERDYCRAERGVQDWSTESGVGWRRQKDKPIFHFPAFIGSGKAAEDVRGVIRSEVGVVVVVAAEAGALWVVAAGWARISMMFAFRNNQMNPIRRIMVTTNLTMISV